MGSSFTIKLAIYWQYLYEDLTENIENYHCQRMASACLHAEGLASCAVRF